MKSKGSFERLHASKRWVLDFLPNFWNLPEIHRQFRREMQCTLGKSYFSVARLIPFSIKPSSKSGSFLPFKIDSASSLNPCRSVGILYSLMVDKIEFITKVLRNFPKFYAKFFRMFTMNWQFRPFDVIFSSYSKLIHRWSSLKFSNHERSEHSLREGGGTVQKFSKKLKKLQKCMIYSKKFKNHALLFHAFGRKTQFVGNFEKTFESFHKNIAKHALYLHIFQKF